MEHKYGEAIEEQIAKTVVDIEYQTAKVNYSGDMADFESYIDLFDAERSEKEYDWHSDIFIPEFPTQMLTQSSEDVAQYFRTRDFVETFVTEKSPEATAAADAAEDLLNTSLNRRELYHYQKYVRAKLINRLKGEVWAHCWWEQEVRNGRILKDHFNYEVLDPRNVFIVDSTYVYSAQQKKAVTIRCERTYSDLLAEKKSHGYFNLDVVKELKSYGQTETKKETRDHDDTPKNEPANKINEAFDKLIRYGLFWYKDGAPGIDENGEVIEGAQLKECIVTFILSGSTKVLIGFRLQPYKDANGNPYKPVIRGLCYIHPTRDNGAGDGRYSQDLQIAVNDTFNLNNDRTFLATIPTIKAHRSLVEDTDELYFEPGHVMPFTQDPNEIQEFQINDNIQGGLAQLGILTEKMREATSTYPPQMGNTPQLASTTATAVANATAGSTRRTNYQSMTFENTFLAELYWMNIQMTWQFAKPETGHRLMGDRVFDFNPNYEYWFRPLSQSIETEYSKDNKIQRWTQILTVVMQSGHPEAAKAFNYIMAKIAKLDGDEYEQFAEMFLNPSMPMQQGGSPANTGGPAVSNQNGLPMSIPEQTTRQATYG